MQRRTILQKVLAGFLTLLVISSCRNSTTPPIITPLPAKEAVQSTPAASQTLPPATLQPIPRQSTAKADTVCTEQKGAWKRDSLPAEGINAEVPFKIYLPPCYSFDPKIRYPILILLHGSGVAGDENMWPNLGLADVMDSNIADGMPPFLVVTPRIYNLQGDFLGVSKTIAKTLVAYLGAHYRIKVGASNRALGGLSYGAIWTLRTATVYPQDFGKLGLHSNAAELDDIVAFSQKMLTLKAENRPLIWMDAGVKDYYLWSNTKMDEVLNTDRISHFWHLGLGAHDQAYWRANLDAYLSFYSAGW